MATESATEQSVLEALPQLAEPLQLIAARSFSEREDVDDAVQETLARATAVIRENRLPTDSPIGAFVYGIFRHVVADIIRERTRERRTKTEAHHLSAHPLSPLDRIVSDEGAEAVWRALARLPEADRALLRRCFVRGERSSDIAQGLGEPPSRVRKRKARALQRLRALLDGAGSRHPPLRLPTSLP